MTTRAVDIALELLDAGWHVSGVVFGGITEGAPTVTVTLATPSITLSANDPGIQRLIARAMGSAKEH